MDMTPPAVKIGWNLEQQANSKELTFAYNPAHFRPNARLKGLTDVAGQGTATPDLTTKNRMPIMGSATGLYDRTGNQAANDLVTPATSDAATDRDAAVEAASPKKYNYWSIRYKPYIET